MGEQGTLTAVRKLQAFASLPARLALEVEYKGGAFVGVIQIDDLAFLDTLQEKLAGCIGRPLTEVGSLSLES